MSSVAHTLLVLAVGSVVSVALILRARRLRDAEPRSREAIAHERIRFPRRTEPAADGSWFSHNRITPPASAALAPPEPIDPLHDDVARMFDYMNFCCAKGGWVDSISMGELKQYARRSVPELLADFLHHYAATHPELIEECVRYSKDLPAETVLYRFKGYEAFLSSAKVSELVRTMT